MARYLFRKGYAYYAGGDLPWIVPESAVISGLTGEGFRVLSFEECEGLRIPFVTPTPCGEGWNYLGFVQRTGDDRAFDMPDRIKWLFELAPVAGAEPQLIDPTPDQGPAPGSMFPQALGVTVLLAGGFLVWVSTRR